MSKRQSTLLNFFQSAKNQKTNGENTPAKSNHTDSKRQKEDDSDEEEIKPKKRSRILVLDEDSDSESEKVVIKKNKSLDSSGSEIENSTPNKSKTIKKESLKTPKSGGKKVAEKGSRKSVGDFSFQKDKADSLIKSKDITAQVKSEIKSEVITDVHSNWLHNTLDFLKPQNIRDAKKRKQDHPDYDARTVYVPENYLNSLTPAMRQWWELKSSHFDSVLFFKVGKFYELYHMDAVVGVTQLGFSYMKGEFAHSGFPETAYGKMASLLIERGYKVARVEQTETPEMMDTRCKSMKKTTKFDKVVKREICQVTTKATTVYTPQLSEAPNELPNFMYALRVKPQMGGTFRLGVCFIETSIRTFYLSEFEDDKHFSKLLALFAEFPATQIITERGCVNKELSEILNTQFRDIRKDTLAPKSQFYTATDTMEKLAAGCYFRDKEDKFSWPSIFKKLADDCLPKQQYELVLSSLGACLWYLKDSLLDIQVFSMATFEWYDPLNLITNINKSDKDYLILDAVTITNLNLLAAKDSLQNVLDHCETAPGKRLLHRWICRPLCNVDKIKERQKAVSTLWNNVTLLKNTHNILKPLPDLERQLAKIHTYGNRFIAKDHPDGRAIFYEEITYSKTKIKDFIKTLKAFESLQDIPEMFRDYEDWLLKKITQFKPVGGNIDLGDTLAYLKSSFDLEEAEKIGKIIPKRGVIDEYDAVEKKIEDIKRELDDYLAEQCKFFGCKVTYFGNDKKRFQLDVPQSKADRATSEYQLEGAKKGSQGSKRYSTPTTKALLAAMMKAEAEKAKIMLDLNRRIFETFSEKYDDFSQVVSCMSILDVLCSLAAYAKSCSWEMCIPEVLPFSNEPQIAIECGRHPCILNIESFVSNDTKIGTEDHPRLLIITGPNMGGKSTLMRQVAVIAVMAQIGSCVPAASCKLNLMDRIFTRLGAQDDIIQGQSTFCVELSEAASILQHASKNSLVLIDELGRGTSTHDGNAIATVYVKKLTTIGCRTLFSTHYHTLVDNFVGREDIQLGHMACMVEDEEDPTQESVIFLYKLAEGRCPKSYGFNAARLAGLDRTIVARGREIAQELEERTNLRNIFCTIFNNRDVAFVRSLLASVNV